MEHIRGDVDGLALDLVGPAAVVPQAAGDGADVALGHGKRLAIVERLDGGEHVQVLLDKVGELGQHDAALLRGGLLPDAIEGFAGGLDGYVDVLLGGLVDGADDLLVGGVYDLERLLVDALNPLVVNEPGAET